MPVVCAFWRLYVGGLVPAGSLLPRFPARVQLPPFAWKRLGQLFLFMQRELAMPYEIPPETIRSLGSICRLPLSGGQQ